MSDRVRIKGFAVRGLLKYVKESGYPGGIPKLLDTLPEEDRKHFAERILSSQWYPYPAFAVLARAIDTEIAKGEVAVLEDVGRSSGHLDLGGVFKFVKSILSIQRVVGRASAYWSRYCDVGELTVIDSSANHYIVRLTEFPDIAEEHCHMICGWMRGLGDGARAEDVDIRKTRCVHRGDPYCEYQGNWT